MLGFLLVQSCLYKWSARGTTLPRKELMNDTSTPQEQLNETPPVSPTPQQLLKERVWSECSALLGTDKDSAFAFECGDLVVHVPKENAGSLLNVLRDSQLQFSMLLDITAVDWMDQREDRFEVVYQLLSISTTQRITVKVALPESAPEIASAVPLFRSANFLEREVWDMFGIRFKGHPDLRRILMYEEFKGHPLRKDYPVQGKQPRVPLRMPEVENTAQHMKRGDLVAIRSRRGPFGAAHSG
jgi:NADH-quinone oxidoreductase subunit C